MKNFKRTFFLILFLLFFLNSHLYAVEKLNLFSSRVDSAPSVDGKSSDSQWGTAKELKVLAEDGPEIVLKSVYTKEEMFFLLQWKDDSESIRPSQWVFDGEKWEILDEVRWEDEEPWDADNDMLGFQWPINDSIEGFNEKGCRKLCHAPEKEDKMFTNNPGEKTDVWLWKAGITDPLGYADSYYLDNTHISRKDEQDRLKRLTAAHKSDDLGEGNLNYVRNNKSGKPIWMPKANSNNGQFLFMGDEVSLDQSKIKKGDAIPGWVLARPKGSRGTINAKGTYDADSKSWTVELRRKLISNDKEHDVQFTNLKKAYYFGLAVWDNEDLLAHTRVKKPIRLSFE